MKMQIGLRGGRRLFALLLAGNGGLFDFLLSILRKATFLCLTPCIINPTTGIVCGSC
jgi:hypothetical protein